MPKSGGDPGRAEPASSTELRGFALPLISLCGALGVRPDDTLFFPREATDRGGGGERKPAASALGRAISRALAGGSVDLRSVRPRRPDYGASGAGEGRGEGAGVAPDLRALKTFYTRLIVSLPPVLAQFLFSFEADCRRCGEPVTSVLVAQGAGGGKVGLMPCPRCGKSDGLALLRPPIAFLSLVSERPPPVSLSLPYDEARARELAQFSGPGGDGPGPALSGEYRLLGLTRDLGAGGERGEKGGDGPLVLDIPSGGQARAPGRGGRDIAGGQGGQQSPSDLVSGGFLYSGAAVEPLDAEGARAFLAEGQPAYCGFYINAAVPAQGAGILEAFGASLKLSLEEGAPRGEAVGGPRPEQSQALGGAGGAPGPEPQPGGAAAQRQRSPKRDLELADLKTSPDRGGGGGRGRGGRDGRGRRSGSAVRGLSDSEGDTGGDSGSDSESGSGGGSGDSGSGSGSEGDEGGSRRSRRSRRGSGRRRGRERSSGSSSGGYSGWSDDSYGSEGSDDSRGSGRSRGSRGRSRSGHSHKQRVYIENPVYDCCGHVVTWFPVLWYVFIALGILTVVNLILCIVVFARTTGSVSFSNVIVTKELSVGGGAPAAQASEGLSLSDAPSGQNGLNARLAATPYDNMSALSYAASVSALSVQQKTVAGDFLQTSAGLDALLALTTNATRGFAVRVANPLTVGAFTLKGTVDVGNMTVGETDSLETLAVDRLVVDSLDVQGNLSYVRGTSFLGNVTARSGQLAAVSNLSGIGATRSLSARDIRMVPLSERRVGSLVRTTNPSLNLERARVYVASLNVTPDPEAPDGGAALDFSKGTLHCTNVGISGLRSTFYKDLRADTIALKGSFICGGKEMLHVTSMYVDSSTAPYVTFSASVLQTREGTVSDTITSDKAQLYYYESSC